MALAPWAWRAHPGCRRHSRERQAKQRESVMQEGVVVVGEPMVDDESRRRVRVTDRLPSEHIDGAWWPRSTNLVAELPALLSTLAERLGHVVMVGYLRNGWTNTPPEIDVAGQTIELLGFDSAEPASVILIGNGGHHLTLRVIAPGTSEQDARQALDAVPERGSGATGRGRAAAVARSLADVADKLARHKGCDDDKRRAEIMRWCEQAAAQFDEARIQTFVPILVEHIVNNRIRRAGTAAASSSAIGSAARGSGISPRTR